MAGAVGQITRYGRGERGFLGACAVLFVASVAATIGSCAPMSAMGGMAMPGGWVLSMAWLRMPGQGWVGFAASFLGTWTAMTVAMMLPPLVPMLRCYRRAVEPAAPSHLGGLTARVGAGYFLAWVVLGAAILPLGLALVQAGLRMPAWARSVPVVGGIAVLLAGVLQLTAWKARRLACCRALPVCGQEQRATAIAAWWLGLRLGGHCIACCAPLMVVLLVAGVMDLRAMAAVTLAIAAERLAPAGERVARLIGVAILVMGMPLVLRAAGLA